MLTLHRRKTTNQTPEIRMRSLVRFWRLARVDADAERVHSSRVEERTSTICPLVSVLIVHSGAVGFQPIAPLRRINA